MNKPLEMHLTLHDRQNNRVTLVANMETMERLRDNLAEHIKRARQEAANVTTDRPGLLYVDTTSLAMMDALLTGRCDT